MKILVFGNPLVKEDSIALKLAKKLKHEFEFEFMDSVEDIENKEKNFIILDCAKGIKKVKLLEDLEKIRTNSVYSIHDFDITIMLKLLKKIGKIKTIKIIAVPYNYNLKSALRQVRKLLTQILQTQKHK